MTFVHADAREPLPGPFDLVCFFDCLHDLGYPVEAARRAREALADDGTLMLVEPYAADRVQDNLNPVGRIYYSGSTWLCCAHAISEDGTHVLGAQAGEARLAQVCREAGFSRVRRRRKHRSLDPRSATLTTASRLRCLARRLDAARRTATGAGRAGEVQGSPRRPSRRCFDPASGG